MLGRLYNRKSISSNCYS